MAQIALITDTHFGVRSDSGVVQEWQKKFLDEVFFPTLDKHQITHVLHGGDYGDRRKYINFSTAQFIEQAYRAPLRRRGITEHVIVGNHDCFLRESTHINSIEEVYRHDASLVIHKDPTEITIHDTEILLLPWICDSNRDASMRYIRDSRCSVVLGHLEISGFQMYRGMPNHEGLKPELFDRFSVVMSGHFHHRSSQGPIHYLGAPYAMVWSDYRDPRGFHLFDTDTHTLTFIENPYSMFARLVYDDEQQPTTYVEQTLASILSPSSPYANAYVKVVVKSKTQPYWFDLVMDALAKINAQDVMVVDDVTAQTEDGTELPEHVSADIDTLSLMTDYVSGLSVTCDKIELQTYLQNTYREALTQSQSARV
jgi:DNA repair exonuclease SbcCD nuclease subunit